MLSSLDVNNHSVENMHGAMGSFSPHEHYTFTNSSDGVALVGTAGDLHLHHQHIEQPQVQQHQSQEASYPSPTSTISAMSPGGGRQSPSAQAGSAPVDVSSSVPISTSSELAFALENKSEPLVG
jgi:hypothetical protein